MAGNRSRLACDVTLEQIDAYFSIGKPIPKAKTVPGLTFQGRPLDPETGRPMEPQEYSSLTQSRREMNGLFGNTPARSIISSCGTGPVESTLDEGDMMQLELDTIPDLKFLSLFPTDYEKDPSFIEVYKHYNFDHTYDESLPVFNHRKEILDMVEHNSVTIIQGETGSGKTTQVPQFILDECAKNGKYCNIVVTQPRKIAATSIARRVCHERNWQLGRLVGYQVGLDKVTSEDTRLTYVTVGVLLRHLVKARQMKTYTHVVLDEVHERDQETDFALLIVRRLLHLNSDSVKVVLMSATFETNEFSKYFSRPVLDRAEPAPVITIKGHVYEVEEHFLDDLRRLGPSPVLNPIDPEISDEAFHIAVQLVKHFDVLEQREERLGHIPDEQSNARTRQRGTVLIFLPGIFFIRELEKMLQGNNLQIVPLHSSITLEEQSLVFAPPKPNHRKVILSTNIAESSITVPDIKYVIDFCLTKCLICDVDTNYQSLRLQWASKSNGIQRKGRAGRISNGKVYRLVTREFWMEQMSQYGIPEMQRCPLEHVILHVKLLDLGDPKSILSLAMSPPLLDNIERTILLLKEVGALSTIGQACKQKYDGDLTFVGRVLAALPMDMRLGKLLLLGYVFGCLDNCVVIAAALSRGTFLATPYNEAIEAYRHRMRWADGSFSDCICLLNAYRAWEYANNTQMFRRKRDEYAWCRQNFIQARRIHEVHMLVRELQDRLQSFNIRSPDQDYWSKDNDEDRELILKVVMAGAFYPNFFSTTKTDEKPALKEICELDPFRTVMLTGLPAGRGPLYSDSIQVALKQCGRQKAIYFDGSKTFMEFCEEENEELHTGSVLPSVYVACKLRENRRSRIQILQSRSETASSLKTLKRPFLYEPINMLDYSKEIPGPGGAVWLPICVTHIVSASHFWGCKAHEPFYSVQQKLFKDVQSSAKTSELHSGAVAPGTLVLAPFGDGSGIWYYRALVQSCCGPRVRLHFVDYGNSQGGVLRQGLKKIPKALAVIPFQAIEFRLKSIRVFGSVSKHEGKKFLGDLLAKTENRCNVKVYSVVSDVVRVDLFTLEDLYVNEHLVKKGLAEVCDEGRLSERSHGEWELAEHNELKSEADYKSMASSSGWRLIPEEGRGAVVPENQREHPVAVYGPKNPFEIGFYSLINIGRLRNARVERDSVNSIVIDQQPLDDHKVLMVAACVGVNESGTTMLARNTTILPNIHGLSHIVAMLFTPVMELRTNRHRMRLTGAICGLGASVTRMGTIPILAEHDMEIEFDVKFDIQDIAKINGIRMKINLAVGSSEDVSSWSQTAIHKLQKNSRKELLGILHRVRQSVTPESFPRPFRWGQVYPDFLVPHEIRLGSADKKDLYRLHDAILLNDVSVTENV